jgi:hypothetical protein
VSVPCSSACLVSEDARTERVSIKSTHVDEFNFGSYRSNMGYA